MEPSGDDEFPSFSFDCSHLWLAHQSHVLRLTVDHSASSSPVSFFQMLFPIFQALLLLLTLAPNRVDGSAAQTRTFKYTDPKTRAQLECDRCPPGTYLFARCTSTKKSVCAPCPQGSFTELWNYIGKCLRCGVCGQDQVVKTACTADSDCQCECKQGFYYKGLYEMCERHSRCPLGHGVLSNGRLGGGGGEGWEEGSPSRQVQSSWRTVVSGFPS